MNDHEERYLKRFKQELDAAAAIVEDRMPTYGLPARDFEFHVRFAELKIRRVQVTRNKEKIIDDLRDAINYCVFAILSLDDCPGRPDSCYGCEKLEDCAYYESCVRGDRDGGEG